MSAAAVRPASRSPRGLIAALLVGLAALPAAAQAPLRTDPANRAASGAAARGGSERGLETALIEDLKAQFERDHGKVRLLVLFSPT